MSKKGPSSITGSANVCKMFGGGSSPPSALGAGGRVVIALVLKTDALRRPGVRIPSCPNLLGSFYPLNAKKTASGSLMVEHPAHNGCDTGSTPVRKKGGLVVELVDTSYLGCDSCRFESCQGQPIVDPSSRWLGHCPFKARTRVRIP